jgi:hypothetical protein
MTNRRKLSTTTSSKSSNENSSAALASLGFSGVEIFSVVVMFFSEESPSAMCWLSPASAGTAFVFGFVRCQNFLFLAALLDCYFVVSRAGYRSPEQQFRPERSKKTIANTLM